MTKYRVTIHEHLIYDHWVEANDREQAWELSWNTIMEDDSSQWVKDFDACWTEIGDIITETELKGLES